jgi:coronin-1B/1C/6
MYVLHGFLIQTVLIFFFALHCCPLSCFCFRFLFYIILLLCRPIKQTNKQECWTDFRLSTVTGDQQYINASAKYFAVGLQGGGGPMMIARHDRPGRFELSTSSYVSGHSGAVLDMNWNPFDDSMLATASEDTNIKIWQIPDDWEPTDDKGNAKEGKQLKESLVDLTAHTKKVTLLTHHPTAANTLLSTGADYTVKIWDIENATAVNSFDDLPNLVHDIVWDMKGDLYACSCKDKNIRIIDPRTATVASKVLAHEGTKSVKLVYPNDSGKLFSFGSSKSSGREIKVWDLKDLSKPVHTEAVDTAAGAMIPLWDEDTSVLYLCGKGDGIVRIYEYEDKAPFIFKLNDGFRSNIPGKGYCKIPKRGLNIMKHETACLLKVTNNEGIHPLHFFVPRKSDAFQDDIFPDTNAPTPAHTFAEWMSGSSKDAVKMSLDPSKNGGMTYMNGGAAGGGMNGHKSPNGGASPTGPSKPFITVATVSKELDEAKKRIAMLEQKLKENNIAF